MNDFEESTHNVLAIFYGIFWPIGSAAATPGATDHNTALEKPINQSVARVLAVATVSGRANHLPHVGDL